MQSECMLYDFVLIDIETTGLYPGRGARVIEVGAVGLSVMEIKREFGSLIDAGKRIPANITKVNGITTDMLAGMPGPEKIWPAFINFIGDSTLVAHNASFDMSFIRHELSRLGLNIGNKTICSLELSKKVFPGLANYKLETLAKHLLGGVPEGLKLHRALSDARLLAMVWIEMIRGKR
ncbi:MAG TPA: 3'-5' exonuclease [Desulfomonilia bacterium]